MSREKMSQYQVIVFEELPYVHIDKYVCVPNTWIIWRDGSREKVVVAYPVEEPSRTQERVRNYENYSRDWKTYMAAAELYVPNGYDEAENFIKYLENKRIGKTDKLNQKRSCENPSTIPMKYIRHTLQPGGVRGEKDESSSDDDDLYEPSEELESSYSSSDDELYEPSELPHPAKAERSRVYKSDKNRVILPPEYDPSPKWTLKYDFFNRRKNERLIELKPGGKPSGIYVDVRGFGKCFVVSTDDMTLAENLMMEIFTETALKVCTLTGRVAVGAGKRYRLYDHAVNVLVSFVLHHGFGVADKQMIRNRLSRKLYKLRSQQH